MDSHIRHDKVIFVLSIAVVLLLTLTALGTIFNSTGIDSQDRTQHSQAIKMSSLSNLNGVPGTGLQVNPFSSYSTEPAPMGIADYGIGPNGSAYSYNTTSFLGGISINSLSTKNSSFNHEMTFQFNVNLVFTNGGSTYVYWVQDVAFVNTSTNQLYFIDNVWNMSSSSASMHTSSISGNGSLGNSSGTLFYYDYANSILPGNCAFLSYPSTIQFMMNSTISSSGVPEVAFMYNDGSGWVTYDNVYFSFASELTQDLGFVVTGNTYEPNGYNPYDAELIMGGPGGGTSTTDIQSNVNLSLQYWNGHNFQEISNAYNFGSHTAETIANAVSVPYYYTKSGSLFEDVTSGSGTLQQVYNSSDISLLNISTPLSRGVVYINGTPHSFLGRDINLTIGPGSYQLKIYNGSILYRELNVTLSAGEYLPLNIVKYQVEFTETGLPTYNGWVLDVNGTSINEYANPGVPIVFNLSNGAYNYTIHPVDSFFYYYGTFNVSGKSININVNMGKSPQGKKYYSVLFVQHVLPNRTNWELYFNPYGYFGDDSTVINMLLTNGTYYYNATNSYNSLYQSGSVNVNGENKTVNISFGLYQVKFTESGLPPGTEWYVNVTNDTGYVKEGSSTSTTITFFLLNGTYNFTDSTSYKVFFPSTYKGSFNVSGSAVNPKVITFLPFTYKVTITESGLPPGTTWYSNVSGGYASGPISGSSYSFNLVNGSYQYFISTSDKGYSPNIPSGTFTVSGSSPPIITIAFSKVYHLTFTENGLSPGTSWNLTFNGKTYQLSNDSYTFYVINGSYSYKAESRNYITITNIITVDGKSETVNIPLRMQTYSVKFTESGLPAGTTWYVNITGQPSSGPLTGSAYSVDLTNGTYTYTVSTSNKVYSPLYSGAFTVAGSPVNRAVTFSQTTLKINISPSDANVTVNGISITISNGKFQGGFLPGYYYVNASANGYSSYSDYFYVSSGQTYIVNITLKPLKTYGYLNGTVSPGSAIIIANAIYIPVSNGHFNASLSPGTYYVSFTANGYSSIVKEVNITAGKATTIDAFLTPVSNSITLSGHLSPGNASLVVDGFVAYVNSTGYYHISLPAGTYIISVYETGYFPYSENVTLSSSKTMNFTLVMEPSATSSTSVDNTTATGFNVTVSNLTAENGIISLSFNSSANGTLIVQMPYTDMRNATISEILNSTVYINGIAYSNYIISISSNYPIILKVYGLNNGDPTLSWKYSPDGVVPTPPATSSSIPLLGYEALGALVVAGLMIGVAIIVLGKRRR